MEAFRLSGGNDLMRVYLLAASDAMGFNKAIRGITNVKWIKRNIAKGKYFTLDKFTSQ